ncbi:GL21717 [Drosophila persimilis]|uniref:GL21717 n=1 Tax=Drosophila persimilis TaxID=7234 RepID=B4GEY2_DROPE|nr:GL21717 [Drosophila persimilis]
MYSKVLPEFERMLRQVDCIYHSLDPRQVMIFEDLMVVRRWFTQEEICSACRKLAEIHAIII